MGDQPNVERDERAANRDQARQLTALLQKQVEDAELRRQLDAVERIQAAVRGTVSAIRSDDTIPELLDVDDGGKYEEWEDKVDNLLYDVGCTEVMAESKKDPIGRVGGDSMDDKVRRALYSKIYASLGPVVTGQIRGITRGEVEQLLAAVRDIFLQKGPATMFRLQDDIQRLALDEHGDMARYIAHADKLVSKF